MFSRVTFILGGAASGKSAFAESLAEKSGKPKVYIATSQILDDEMRARVRRHQNQRGTGWTTLQVPHDLAPALETLHSGQVCLLDCATMWLSNHLLGNSDLAAEYTTLIDAISACPADLIIVSNEVGHGIVPDNALSRQFREAQGRLNIALAAQADLVVQVTAGLPLVLKGALT